MIARGIPMTQENLHEKDLVAGLMRSCPGNLALQLQFYQQHRFKQQKETTMR